jgi:DNA processing protein
MSFISERTVRLAGVRTVMSTARTLAKLENDYPFFIHKWTRQRRRYTFDDLSLPKTVFVYGKWPDWDSPVVGIGGTRSPTVETFCLVTNIVRELAKSGVVIVSGGVPGVDLAAHMAAMDQRGCVTLAVLANPAHMGFRGHEWFNDALDDRLPLSGAFVSEYSRVCDVGSPEYRERLLARDRVISGLCDMFIAFECNEDSATVDTARRAFVQGKQIMCVDSVRRSARRGVAQLASELAIAVFDEGQQAPKAIAGRIMDALTGLGIPQPAK